ncbi:MAK10-like protein [Tanacetum coccineum]
MEDLRLFTLPCRLGNSKPFDTLANLGSCVNIIPLYLFKKLNIGLLEETDHIFGLADGTKSYTVRIIKDVEVHIGKLKLLNDFYMIDIKKDLETPLLVGRGFLATANVVIDCRKAKIAVGEGITRSVFRVQEVDLGAQTPYYARKDFLDCHLPGEWEIARDAELNPFKDVFVGKRMVEFLGAIPINLKSNMWESEDLIKNLIHREKPPKNGDGAWHAKIRLIDLDGEEFTKTLQSIPTTKKLSERERNFSLKTKKKFSQTLETALGLTPDSVASPAISYILFFLVAECGKLGFRETSFCLYAVDTFRTRELFLGEDATRAIPNMGFNLVHVESFLYLEMEVMCVEFGCHFEVELECKFTLSPLDVLQGFSFFLQMSFTLILATLDGLDVGLLGDVIGEDDCDDDG